MKRIKNKIETKNYWLGQTNEETKIGYSRIRTDDVKKMTVCAIACKDKKYRDAITNLIIKDLYFTEENFEDLWELKEEFAKLCRMEYENGLL